MFLTKEQKVLQQVLRRAKRDDAFKQSLIADPVAAIHAETGVEVAIPEGRELVVEDQTDPNVIYVNIPPRPEAREDVELTEEQLELVAGGRAEIRPFAFDPGQIVCFPTPPINPGTVSTGMNDIVRKS